MSTGFAEVDTNSSMSVHVSNAAEPTALPPLPPEPQTPENGDILRSASYTSLPGVSSASQGIRRTFSENVLGTLIQKPAKVTPSMQSANVELFRRASSKTKRRMSDARLISSREVDTRNKSGFGHEEESSHTKDGNKSMTGTLRSLARKSSWIPSSRSSSPGQGEKPKLQKKRSESPRKGFNVTSRSITIPEPAARRTSQPKSTHHAEELPPKIEDLLIHRDDSAPITTSRAVSEVSIDHESATSSKGLSRQSSATSLKSRASNDQLYLSMKPKMPPLPKTVSPDRSSNQSTESKRGRDPLWNAFRAMDGEYSSFHSKTSLQKAKVIRAVLLPFMTKHAHDPSTFVLRAEDLDRRIVILNKWWTGLLELLNGSHNQSISGTDRPAFLEAITELMMRPEWRTPPLQSSTIENPSKRPGISKTESNQSNQSVDSQDSDFLLLSIYQNIRNIFSQNLLSQMAFVVEKLSMRNAPASLVSFSGKACAYAFVFCPGVADTLSRLWHIPSGTLRRVFAEYGAADGRKVGVLSRELASFFPLPLRTLCFTSQASLARHLQHKAQMPPGSGYIRWYGPWVNRWIGRDSDLFFVFAKQYHILISQFLPRSTSLEERVSIPGFAPLHAQLLIVLESTLYRQAGHFAAENYLLTPGDNPDALAPLPMVIPNATRSIGENRLVMLMRDLVSDTKPEHITFVELLVRSFQCIMKAATRKISMYNNDACYVLCDLLEELLPMISKYNHSHNDYEDWSFWCQVFKQLMLSQTTMTQIRAIAFLYSMWTILVYNEERKKEIVLDWLLETAFFRRFFSHWSPMVRHYFSRLICWRVARCDGLVTEVDIQIFQKLATLLNTCWAHHQYLTADAEMRQISPPLTNPCSPAPGRSFLIIRLDSQPVHGSFTSFDRLMHSHDNSPYSDHSTSFAKLPEAETQSNAPKKRWSILRTINPFGNPGNNKPGEVTPPGSPLNGPIGSRFRTMGSKGQSKGASSRPSTPPYQALSFKFSLEYTPNRPNFNGHSQRLSAPVLPHNAQRLLEEHDSLQRDKANAQLDNESSSASSSGAASLRNTSSTLSSPARSVSSKNDVRPLKPKHDEMDTARYDGRALSEWHQVVAECRNFYLRRKQEGCPKDAYVETPALAVETFRMFG